MKPIVMVVEDEVIVAESLRVTLQGMGYGVPPAACRSDEALTLADECHPDLILMDIILEGSEMDGVETARRIRARHDVPVVFVTAYADDETLDRVIDTEPSAYILKPFNERELYSAIELALHRHRMEMAIKKRDNILFAISFAVEWFLRHLKESNKAKAGHPGTFDSGIVEVLEHIGLAVDATTVAIFRMDQELGGLDAAKVRYVWCAPGTPDFLSHPPQGAESLKFSTTSSLWRTLLSSGNSISGDIAIFPENERKFFEQCGVASMAIIPLFRNDLLWGFIGIATADLRDWSESEMEALRVAGNIIGALLE